MNKRLAVCVSIVSFLLLASCGGNQVKPVDLSASKSSVQSLKVSHIKDRVLFEATYSTSSGEDKMFIAGGDANGNGQERLTNGRVALIGLQPVNVNMDFSELGMAVRYAAIDKKMVKYRIGPSLNHQQVENEFIGTTGRFATDFSSVNLWLDHELVVNLTDRISFNFLVSLPMTQRYFLDNTREKISLKYQALEKMSIELGWYSFSVAAEDQPNISYEQKNCSVSGSSTVFPACPSTFVGERSDVNQIFSAVGFTLGFNF